MVGTREPLQILPLFRHGFSIINHSSFFPAIGHRCLLLLCLRMHTCLHPVMEGDVAGACGRGRHAGTIGIPFSVRGRLRGTPTTPF